jgi:SAM-dependent methyltransferase
MDKSMKQTRQSFDYQWANVKDSPWLLSSPEFKARCVRFLLDELGLSTKDVFRKIVLDVGCGNGRWSYAFQNLGANIIAYDYTRNGCLETSKLGIDVVLADALNPPFKPNAFDIVFSFGVLHHTGDLKRAFSENAKLVKSGGIMHVYLYARKSSRLKIWRMFVQSMPLEMRKTTLNGLLRIKEVAPSLGRLVPYKNLHEGFDAISPRINDESDDGFVREMFSKNDFIKVKRIKTTWCNWKPDIHMQGAKSGISNNR